MSRKDGCARRSPMRFASIWRSTPERSATWAASSSPNGPATDSATTLLRQPTDQYLSRSSHEVDPRALFDAHILGARAFRPLTALERHSLAFAQFIEPRAVAGRLVEEILAAV